MRASFYSRQESFLLAKQWIDQSQIPSSQVGTKERDESFFFNCGGGKDLCLVASLNWHLKRDESDLIKKDRG